MNILRVFNSWSEAILYLTDRGLHRNAYGKLVQDPDGGYMQVIYVNSLFHAERQATGRYQAIFYYGTFSPDIIYYLKSRVNNGNNEPQPATYLPTL